MKLRTKLQISAILPILLALTVSFILIDISTRMGNITLRQRAADGIVMTVFKLNTATYRYESNPSPQSREDWQDRYINLGVLLAREASEGTGDKAIFDVLRKYHKEMRSTFRQLVENHDAGQQDDETHQKRFSTLLAQSQSMVTEAMALASVARAQASGIQETAYRIIIGTSGALAGILAMLALFISKAVSRNVMALQDGIHLVAQGKLEHRLVPRGSDEMTDLANGFNAMAQDLSSATTEREKVTEDLRKSNRELSDALIRLKRAQSDVVQQERLQALRQIARGIVHDMNDALMPILGMSEIYMQHPEALDKRDEVIESLSAIHQAATKAAKVVSFLSDFFRPSQAGETQPVDVATLVDNAIAMTEPLWKQEKDAKGIRINVEADIADIPPFEGNEAELREALTNLILNAVDAITEQGTVIIRARTQDKAIVIEVEDSGVGMSKEVADRCREPFFSTKEKPHSGMGLTAAWGIIQRCHGSLDVKSSAGGGTTVSIELPMKRAQVSSGPDTDSKPMPEKLHVLTIDDEAWTAMALERLLAADGYSAESASDGTRGIEAFKAGSFDLVIVDRAMPDMSGDDVAAEIRKLNAGIRIIMLTGFGDLMLQGGELPAGVNVVIGKPMSHDDLRDAIARAFQD